MASAALELLREFKAENILCDVEKCHVGQGSYGKVLLGKHKKTGFLAIKCFKVTGGEHEQLLAEKIFRREYEALLQSRHDNISVVHGYTKWPGAIGMVMQFYGGGTLRFLLLDEDITLGVSLILRMATEISSAVGYIHNCGLKGRLVHGDLKPENVFVTKDLHCIVGDFGCARIIKLTAGTTTQLPGQAKPQGLTLYYAAPERLLQYAKPKKEQDAYSCGIMFFEMLSREEPYQSEQECWHKIERGLRPDCEAIDDLKEESDARNREIVEVMERAMVRCWDQDPLKRPDMATIRDKFQQLLSKQDHTVILQQVATAASNMHIVDPAASHKPTIPLSQYSTQTWKFHAVGPEIKSPQGGSNQPSLQAPEVQRNQPPVSRRQEQTNRTQSKTSESKEQNARPPSNAALQNQGHSSVQINALRNHFMASQSSSRVTRDLTGFLVIGGKPSANNCVKWNVRTKQHQYLPKLQSARECSTSARINNIVYVMGGWGPIKSCEMLDLNESKRWIQIADLPEARASAASSVVQDRMFLSGGCGVHGALKSCMVYDNSDRWIHSFDMLQPRLGHGMCSIDNSIYCIAGHDGEQILGSCEHRDVRSSTSSCIASLSAARTRFACVETGGKIYAIGGLSHEQKFQGVVEEYEPRINKWRKVAPLQAHRNMHSACAINGRIYVVAGQRGMPALKSVEVYYPASNAWTHCFDVKDPAVGATVVAV